MSALDPLAHPGHGIQCTCARLLRRGVLIVALLNFSCFFVEFAVALVAGSVSLFADSVDFLEDTAIDLLIFAALGWPLPGAPSRARPWL